LGERDGIMGGVLRGMVGGTMSSSGGKKSQGLGEARGWRSFEEKGRVGLLCWRSNVTCSRKGREGGDAQWKRETATYTNGCEA